MESEDWRLTGQERFLQGATLERAVYASSSAFNDHDHCELCGAKFMVQPGPDSLTMGYCTPDRYRWVCEPCFADFRERFKWKLTSSSCGDVC